MGWGWGSLAGRGLACTARRQAPPGRSPTVSRQSRRRTRSAHARRRRPWSARRLPPRPPGLPRATGAGCRRFCRSSRPPQQAGIGHRVPLYRMGGDTTVTGNVTWLSPAACDPGKRVADIAQGTRSGRQAMRVLVTEDDEILASAVAAGLRREGMAVDVTLDGAAALERLAVNRYDVVVLDRDLPGVHGDDVCRTLAAGGSGTRVLMLTAARSVRERVEGLDLGADDYL